MKFENTYAQLPDNFYSRIYPTPVASPQLIKWNSELADQLQIQMTDEKELVEIFSGNKVPEGADPIAMAYAGHQFGHFVPQLGDGRALLLGEINSKDIQLKGSGPTKFSRNGDGRSSLGPVIREYILSEAMYHLGVPTTRALAAVRSGEQVYRQTAIPGGVFTRVASSHLRIGSFEYFAAKKDLSSLQTLMDYAIQRLYPECAKAKDPALNFFKEVIQRQASLVAQWMSLGFIHGVMNTDNTSISGETIDYGPCAFMDVFEAHKVFSSIDVRGRYSYGNQASIIHWNLSCLANCLVPLSNFESIQNALNEFPQVFEKQWMHYVGRKFGFNNQVLSAQQVQLIKNYFAILEKEKMDFTISFRKLSNRLFEKETDEWTVQWKSILAEQDLKSENVAESMLKVNPKFIPRNHQVERAIQASINNDDTIFHELCEVLKNPYKDQADYDEYALPPKADEVVEETFCGT